MIHPVYRSLACGMHHFIVWRRCSKCRRLTPTPNCWAVEQSMRNPVTRVRKWVVVPVCTPCRDKIVAGLYDPSRWN